MVGEDAYVELNDVLVLVDCLDDAHKTHFFKRRLGEGDLEDLVVGVLAQRLTDIFACL